MKTENRNKELLARKMLVFEPMGLIGERDIEKRYQLFSKYEELTMCPHCRKTINSVNVKVIGVDKYIMTDRNNHYYSGRHIESIEYTCSHCGGEIDKKVVKFLFGELYAGDDDV